MPKPLILTPKLLLVCCAFFFCASYLVTEYPDVPGAFAGALISTALIAMPSVLALFRFLGTRRAALSLAALGLLGFAIEVTGVATGFPYGHFFYGDSLGPKIFGLVPYLLPVSWVPLVIGAAAAAAPSDASQSGSGRLVFWIAYAALLLTLVDGVLDPGAAALEFWTWSRDGAYYGVPASNYFGWLLSSALAVALLLALGGRRWKASVSPEMADSLLIALAFWTGVAVFSGLMIPAALGLVLLLSLLGRRMLPLIAVPDE